MYAVIQILWSLYDSGRSSSVLNYIIIKRFQAFSLPAFSLVFLWYISLIFLWKTLIIVVGNVVGFNILDSNLVMITYKII